MLLEKLARAIACKHCENPSKLYELQIHADEQAREILRLNHVLDEVKKERDAARQAADEKQLLCGGTHNFRQMVALRDAGVVTEEERKNLTCGSGGKSNPALMEWLMGFPIGWTSLNASETR